MLATKQSRLYFCLLVYHLRTLRLRTPAQKSVWIQTSAVSPECIDKGNYEKCQNAGNSIISQALC